LEETLRLLYSLQTVDTKLDELEELKGDLPEVVKALESDVNQIKDTVKEKENIVTASVKTRNKADLDIHDFKEKLEKYKSQQYSVRNNKEYDALTKEIDFAEQSIKDLEGQFSDLEKTMDIAKNEITELTQKLEEVEKNLEEKRKELAEVSKATEEEELKLAHEREKIKVRLQKDILPRYERIRKARDGRAVVPVKRNSCGGCHNRIPPQRILELRTNTKMFTCEHCGRILVSPEIAESVTTAS
jgi:predicted  nucleic acid-binding Zn-ribbon protein